MDILGGRTDQQFDELQLEEWLREILRSRESEEHRRMTASLHRQETHSNSADTVSTPISRSWKGLCMYPQVLSKFTTGNYYSNYSKKYKKMKNVLIHLKMLTQTKNKT